MLYVIVEFDGRILFKPLLTHQVTDTAHSQIPSSPGCVRFVQRRAERELEGANSPWIGTCCSSDESLGNLDISFRTFSILAEGEIF